MATADDITDTKSAELTLRVFVIFVIAIGRVAVALR
jgi:hypothetical protein